MSYRTAPASGMYPPPQQIHQGVLVFNHLFKKRGIKSNAAVLQNKQTNTMDPVCFYEKKNLDINGLSSLELLHNY